MEISLELVPYPNNSAPNQIERVKFIRTGNSYDEDKVTMRLLNSESFDTTECQLDLDELIRAVEILKATRQKD